MAFGTAIHQALELLFSRIIETSEKPPLQDVLHSYKVSLNKEMLISYDFERRLEYGYLVLENYWQQLDANLSKPLFLEKQFGFGKSKTMLGDILLTGRIDRIDLIDADQKLVRVVDYKTGKSKSDNEIKGKTESAGLSEREQALPETIRGAYQRQLVFYKLLSELDVNFTHKVTEAVFEFVEPDKKSGKTIYRNLVISDQAVADLRKLIIEVMSEIRSLKFLEFPELLQSD
jgi:ATP-dependent exoDNAse (exonuclease V) beta subunit